MAGGQRKAGFAVVILLVLIGAVFVLVLRPDRPAAPAHGGPVLPVAPTTRAEEGEVAVGWRAPGAASSTVQFGVDGLSPDDVSFVVTSRALVLRLGDRFGDDPATGVVALARGNGRQLWRLDLPGAWCARDPVVLDGAELVACAGTDRFVLLDPVTGEVLVDEALAVVPQAVATTSDGVVLVGPTDPGSGSTMVSWHGLDGELRWSLDLAVEDPDFVLDLRQTEEGYAPWRYYAADLGGPLLLAHDRIAYHLDPEGIAGPVECDAVLVDDTGYVCSAWWDSARYTLEGDLVWEGGPPLAPTTFRWRAVLPLAEATLDGNVYSYRVLDPLTGAEGQEVMRSRSWTFLGGTDEVALGSGSEGFVRFRPDGTGVMWWRAHDPVVESGPVAVGSDRVLVSDDDYRVTVVLDAATGVELLRARAGLGSCRPVAGRDLLCWDLSDLELVTLP